MQGYVAIDAKNEGCTEDWKWRGCGHDWEKWVNVNFMFSELCIMIHICEKDQQDAHFSL
jgi:hypothetical protein